jgi:hypothetical protein
MARRLVALGSRLSGWDDEDDEDDEDGMEGMEGMET